MTLSLSSLKIHYGYLSNPLRYTHIRYQSFKILRIENSIEEVGELRERKVSL
jgi:hypothetical protein